MAGGERRTGRRWRIAGWALLLAVVAAYAEICYRLGNDFLAFYDAAEASRLHGDIYAPGPRAGMFVPYVPYFTLVLSPLTLLPPRLAAWLWYALKVGAMVFLVRWVRRGVRAEAPGAGLRAAAACTALPFVIAYTPFIGEFRLGQANLFVLLFSILTVQALERRRPALAAFLYSLAVVKVTALVLLPWLLLRRQWRFLLAGAAVGAGWLLALAAWWGPARVPGLFAEWIAATGARKTGLSAVAYYENQSLQGVAGRLAVALPALQRPVLGLPAHVWLWVVPCLAVLAVLAVSAARDGFARRCPPEEFALASLLMLMASSDSRWAHHVQLLPPLAVLAALAGRTRLFEGLPRVGGWFAAGEGAAAPAGPAARRLRRVVLGLTAAGVVVLVLCGRDVIGRAANQAVRAWSLPAAIDVALAVFLARRLLAGPALREGAQPVASP